MPKKKILESNNTTKYARLPDLFVVSSIISIAFVTIYFLFFLLAPYFRFYPSISKESLNSWMRPVVSNKGIEVYVLFFGTILNLFLVYFLIINHNLIPFIKKKIIQFFFLGLLIGKIFTTFPTKISGVNKSLSFNILILLTTILFIWA